MNEKMMSPMPKTIKVGIDFPSAIRGIIDGKKITKLEWQNESIYGILKEERLKLHKEDGKFYDWILSQGDLEGEDWIII